MGVLAMVPILGMAGFAIDLGGSYMQRAQLQMVADSAAMAGAVSWVKTGSTAAATATIRAVVLANGWSAEIIQATPAYLSQSPRNNDKPAIQVSLSAPWPYVFLRVITASSSVATTAYAAVEIGSASTKTIVPTIFGTGVNASGAVLTNGTNGDPHYILSYVPSGASTTVQVDTSGNSGNWPTASTTSAWISPVGGANSAPNGRYGYTTTFDLTGFDPTTLQISGEVGSDDTLAIQVNSADSFSANSSYRSPVSFTITSGFVAGVNTVIFHVTNTGGATLLRVEMTGTASQAGKIALVK